MSPVHLSRRQRLCLLVPALTLLFYVGAYIGLVQGLSQVTFSAGPDDTDAEYQMIWERTFPLGRLFVPLETIDRKIRPSFWEWEEYVKKSDLKTWLKDKRMQ
jgi:hypothetical protein